MGLTEFDSSLPLAPRRPSRVQITSPVHRPGEGLALPLPGAAMGSSSLMSACKAPLLDPAPLEGVRGEAGGGVSHSPSWSQLFDLPALHVRCGLCLLGGVPLSKPLVGSCVWGLAWAPLHWGTTHGLGRTSPGTGWRTRCVFSLKRMSEPTSSASFSEG